MKIEQRNGKDERHILTGIIVDSTVCAHVAAVWEKEGLFKNKWANLIAGWAIRYFERYGKSPGAQIEVIFDRWAEKGGKDKETVKLVEKFLHSLSNEYEREDLNPEYIIDHASDYFNDVKLQKLTEAIEVDLTDGDRLKALERVSKFGQVHLGAKSGIDVLRDQNAMREAFEQRGENLIKYPEALEYFFADALERDAFIAFMGPEKRGKTWWLIDLAWRAMLQRRRVAFFSVGDMSQHQMMRRFQVRAAKRPLRAKKIRYPKSIEHIPGMQFATTEFEEREFTEPLTWRQGLQAFEKVIAKTKSNSTLLRLACYPNSTLSVAGIASIMATWEREGWVPDVVVIDYADILANLPGYVDGREAINASWKYMRRLSQERHCLVVTATQSDAASYKADTLEASNFSEDKRKFAHVTGMVGLNSSSEEKQWQLMRLNWLVLRESEFNVTKCCHVAGCFDIGNPAVKSTF